MVLICGGRMLVNCKVNHGVSDVSLIELSWFMCGSAMVQVVAV